MENNLSALLTGFSKTHSTQHCLKSMIENWKNTLDIGRFVAAIIMDHSRVFDILNPHL